MVSASTSRCGAASYAACHSSRAVMVLSIPRIDVNARSDAVPGPIGAFVGMGVFWGTWAALLPEIKRATGSTDGQLGLAIGLALTAALPAMLLTGRAHDRFGARLLPVTLVLLAFGALLPGFATS